MRDENSAMFEDIQLMIRQTSFRTERAPIELVLLNRSVLSGLGCRFFYRATSADTHIDS